MSKDINVKRALRTPKSRTENASCKGKSHNFPHTVDDNQLTKLFIMFILYEFSLVYTVYTQCLEVLLSSFSVFLYSISVRSVISS